MITWIPEATSLGGTVPEKNKRLSDILNGINSINFGNFEENDIDAFGDAYEFLISNYASNAGKSGGEFFTPQTVSKLLARLVMVGKIRLTRSMTRHVVQALSFFK